MFAKIFETQDHGQILIKIDSGSEGEPEVRIYFEPPGFGVCSFALKFEDDDWDAAEKVFDKMSESRASSIVIGLKSKIESGFVE